jgi:hypothetical protein
MWERELESGKENGAPGAKGRNESNRRYIEEFASRARRVFLYLTMTWNGRLRARESNRTWAGVVRDRQVSRRDKLDGFADGRLWIVLSSFRPMVFHHFFERVEKIGARFFDCFTLGEYFGQFFEMASEAAFRSFFEHNRECEIERFGVHSFFLKIVILFTKSRSVVGFEMVH